MRTHHFSSKPQHTHAHRCVVRASCMWKKSGTKITVSIICTGRGFLRNAINQVTARSQHRASLRNTKLPDPNLHNYIYPKGDRCVPEFSRVVHLCAWNITSYRPVPMRKNIIRALWPWKMEERRNSPDGNSIFHQGNHLMCVRNSNAGERETWKYWKKGCRIKE